MEQKWRICLIGDLGIHTEISDKLPYGGLADTTGLIGTLFTRFWGWVFLRKPHENLSRVLEHVLDSATLPDLLVYLGDLSGTRLNMGLAHDVVEEELVEFKMWLRKTHPLTALVPEEWLPGNHDLCTKFMGTQRSASRLTARAIARFVALFNDLHRVRTFGWCTFVSICSELVMLYPEDQTKELLTWRNMHIHQLASLMADPRRQNIVWWTHNPEVFRILGDPDSIPECRDDLKVINGNLDKLITVFCGHLERPRGDVTYKTLLPLVEWLMFKPAIRVITRGLVKVAYRQSPDAVSILCEFAANSAKAIRLWPKFEPVYVVPAPAAGRVELEGSAEFMDIVRYDRRNVREIIRRIPRQTSGLRLVQEASAAS